MSRMVCYRVYPQMGVNHLYQDIFRTNMIILECWWHPLFVENPIAYPQLHHLTSMHLLPWRLNRMRLVLLSTAALLLALWRFKQRFKRPREAVEAAPATEEVAAAWQMRKRSKVHMTLPRLQGPQK